MAWTDVATVLAMTGISVSESQIDAAQGVVDIFSNVTEDAKNLLGSRDKRLLGSAVAYQAAWMTRQIDVFTRLDVSEVDQDEVSFKPSGENSLILAPLARRCLERLSWRRQGSIRVQPTTSSGVPVSRLLATQAGFLRDHGVGNGAADGDWLPLP